MVWPATHLARNGVNVKLKDPRKNHLWTEQKMVEDFLWADVIVAYNPDGKYGPKLLSMCKQSKKKLVIDMDDYSFAVDPSNDAYARGGTQDVYVNDQPLWVDGVHYSRDTVLGNHERWLHMLNYSDALSVTTGTLGDFYAGFTDDVWVLPNCLDLDYYKPWDRRHTEDEIRIGWQGGSSHLKDMKMVIPALKEIKAKNKNVKLVIMGQYWGNIMGSLGKDRVEYYPWVDSDAYPLKLGSIDLDIGICPIEDTMFNKGKSNLKQVEYGAFSVPSVCSDIERGPYSYPNGITDHGVDGMLTKNTTEDWVENLQYMVDNPSERVEMGKKYRQKVEALYDIKETWGEWRKCYSSVGTRILEETG